MKVQDKVAEIAKLCVEITMNTEHDVCFEYHAHSHSINVEIFDGGWDDSKELSTHLYKNGKEQDLTPVIEQLQDLLK